MILVIVAWCLCTIFVILVELVLYSGLGGLGDGPSWPLLVLCLMLLAGHVMLCIGLVPRPSRDGKCLAPLGLGTVLSIALMSVDWAIGPFEGGAEILGLRHYSAGSSGNTVESEAAGGQGVGKASCGVWWSEGCGSRLEVGWWAVASQGRAEARLRGERPV
jgi:hypothetical protein